MNFARMQAAANAINLLKPSILVNTDRIKKQTNSDLNKKQKKNGQMISGFLEPQTCYKVCMCNPLEHDRH